MSKRLIAALLAGLATVAAARDSNQPNQCEFCDLRYRDFSNTRIQKAEFPGAYLYGANFSWAVVEQANFESAALTWSRMDWASLDGANFRKAAMENVAMSRSSVRQADFSMASMARADFSRSDLSGSQFVTATLQEAQLTDARLNGANLRNANLLRANLSGARLRDANLSGALLRRADLQGADLGNANFAGANMDEVNLADIEIRQANFRGASLKNVNFRNAVLDAVNFQNADLSGADFTGATIRNAMLSGANLCKTTFPNGTVRECTPGTQPDDERNLMGAKPENMFRMSLAGNAFANFQRGRPTGIFAEMGAKLIRDMGLQPNFIAMPADAALKALEENRLDAATVIIKTDRIRDKFWFSEPVVTDYQVVAVKRGKGFPLKKASDLNGKRVGLRQGYRYDLLAKATQIQRHTYQSDGDMIRALLQGEVDAILLAGIADVFSFRSEGIMSQLELLGASVGQVPLVMAFRKSRFSADDVANFNRRLAESNRDGTWRELMERNGMGDLMEPLPPVDP